MSMNPDTRSLASPKFLCMCQGGNVRSVSLAFVLEHQFQQDALACGWSTNPEATRIMLYQWADFIVLMQAAFAEHVPAEFKEKIRVVDVGPDTYGTPMHSSLLDFLSKVVAGWQARNFKI